MKPNHDKVLKQYNEACDLIAAEFVSTYFACEPEGEEPGYDWVGDEAGGVLCVNDYYWGMSAIVQALDLTVDERTLFDWYEHSISHPEEHVNLAYFVKNDSHLTQRTN